MFNGDSNRIGKDASMQERAFRILPLLLLACLGLSCSGTGECEMKFTGAAGEVKLLTLDPGHFHAALVQKTMYGQVSPFVTVYAPEGPDVVDHGKRIGGFNSRSESPTSWNQTVYKGDGFLQRMIDEKRGNVVVISGNNRKKAQYIKACVDAGLNVLSDKPMCIDSAGCAMILDALADAEKKGLLLYDIMTERSEITTILQKELAHCEAVFGAMEKGSVDEPAVVKESVHHFFKYVAGNPLKRPEWFCDTAQQGEGIVDVTTHLVDLVLWECFPGEVVDFDDVVIKVAKRWPTPITLERYRKVTRLDDFPGFLKKDLDESGCYPCYANGEIRFAVRGIHAKVKVVWDFQAPEGGGDTHYSVMRGTLSNLVIRQGREQSYRPELYVEPAAGADKAAIGEGLAKKIAALQPDYPGVGVKAEGDGWRLLIPDALRIGHEAHFRQVTERYLKYLVDGRLPAWERPNMITKYRITTGALDKASAAGQ